jgi:hypothetical protein
VESDVLDPKKNKKLKQWRANTKDPSTFDEFEIFSNYSWVRPIFELSNGIGTKIFLVEGFCATVMCNFHRWSVDNLRRYHHGTN